MLLLLAGSAAMACLAVVISAAVDGSRTRVCGWVALGIAFDMLLRIFGGAGVSPIGTLSRLSASACAYRKMPDFVPAASRQFAMVCGLMMAAVGAGLFLVSITSEKTEAFSCNVTSCHVSCAASQALVHAGHCSVYRHQSAATCVQLCTKRSKSHILTLDLSANLASFICYRLRRAVTALWGAFLWQCWHF